MSISHHVPATPSGGSPVVAAAVTALRDLAETLWAGRSDEELVGVVEQITQVRSVLAALEAGVVAEADARGIAKTRLHYGSTGDWLTHTGGLRRGEGRRVVARARALTGPLGRTRQGLLAGVVSPVQADVIVRSVSDLPSGELVRARGEKVLVDHAARLDASDLARTGRHLAHVVDPDRVDRRLEAALEREERAAHLDRHLSIVEDHAGGIRLRGRGSVEDGAWLKAVLLPLTRPQPAETRTGHEAGEGIDDPALSAGDVRGHGARLWDALILVARTALDTGLTPTTHRTPPRLLITLDHHTLKGGLDSAGVSVGVGTTAEGLDLPAGVIRRLACDAELIPIVYGTHSEVLDVGRTRRLVTPALWTALVARDGHCTFPACHRPPTMCHAHHLIHWLHHGPTELDNLTLLCGHHHRVIHHTPWQIRLNPDDRKPEYLPPPKPGTTPTWTRQRPRTP